MLGPLKRVGAAANLAPREPIMTKNLLIAALLSTAATLSMAQASAPMAPAAKEMGAAPAAAKADTHKAKKAKKHHAKKAAKKAAPAASS